MEKQYRCLHPLLETREPFGTGLDTHTHIYSTSSPCKKVSMLDGIGHLPPIKTGGADIDGQWKLWPFAAWKIEMTPQLAASARAHVVTLGVAGAFGVHQEESEV